MLRLISLLVATLAATCLSQAQARFIIEVAGGAASPHAPFSSKWNGAVRNGGLFYKEYAIKGSYSVSSYLSLASTIGWAEDRNQPADIWFSPASRNSAFVEYG